MRWLAAIALVALVVLAPAAARAQDAIIGPPDGPPIGPDGSVGTDGGLIVNPASLDLGVRDLGGGATSLSGGFDLENKNTQDLIITVYGYYKPATSQCAPFSIDPNGTLPQIVPQSTSVSWSVSFSSSTPGFYWCRVDIQDDDGDYDFIDLYAEVVTPVMVVSPLSINFGDVVVSGSSMQSFSIQNNGSSTLIISGVNKTGSADFSMSPVLTPLYIPPATSQYVTITYSPGAVGADSGQVAVAGNDPANPGDNVALTGNGVADNTAPHLLLSPSPVAFGSVTVGGNGNRTLTITNDGAATAEISQLAITGSDASQFTLQSVCPGAQVCNTPIMVTTTTPVSVNLRCTPTSSGDKFATLAVTSDASNSPTNVSLTCTGNAPDVAVSPLGVDFGTIRLGTASAAQTVTVRNNGNAPLEYTLSETGDGGDFAATPPCTTTCTLAPGGMTNHAVVFTPQAYGSRGAQLHVVSNDPVDGDVPVNLAGIGGAGLLTVVSPTSGSLVFGDIPISTTSSGQPIQIRNDGNMSLTLSQLELTSGTVFAIGGTVPPPNIVITPGTSHTVTVTCAPVAVTDYLGTIAIAGNDPMDPDRTINLSCSGVDSALAAMPAPISFAATRVGDSDVIPVSIRNVSGGTVTVSAIGPTPAVFTTEGLPALPMDLAANQTIDFDLRFTPAADGDVAGTLTVTSSANPLEVSLLGPGRLATFSVDPLDYNFGTVCVGQSVVSRFTVTSTGSADIVLELPALTDPDGAFDIAMIDPAPADYPATLPPTSTAVFDVVAMPPEGDSAGLVSVTTDVTPDGTAGLPISVTAIAEGIALSPADVDFGGVIINETSANQSVTLSNCDDVPLIITAVDLTGADAASFTVGGTLPPPDLMVAVQGSIQWTVVFEPTRLGDHSAALEITTSTGVVTVPLVGVGTSAGGDGGPTDGGPGFDTTSFYACACRGGADAGGAAPIVVALVLLFSTGRRRRRSR